MRILMVSGSTGKAEGGVAGVVHNLAKELDNLGHSVVSKFFEDLLPTQKWPSRFRTVEFARQIARYIQEKKDEFDIINIHAPFGFWYGARRRLRGNEAGPPYVMTMHGLEERRNYAMGREASQGRADHFRWKDRVWLVPNGVGPEFFHVRSCPAGIATKLLFVGTWIDHKGIYCLAEAFKKVLRVIPDARLTIAGCLEPEGKVRRCFPSAAQAALEVWPFVARAEISSLYAEHEIFVLPSLMEGMPLVLLEAMASGIPVVTTESSGMSDMVEDSYDGLLVTPGDANSLSAAIVRLCHDAELRARLGSAAQEKMKRHTWSACARRYEMVFNRAMSADTNTVGAAKPKTSTGEDVRIAP